MSYFCRRCAEKEIAARDVVAKLFLTERARRGYTRMIAAAVSEGDVAPADRTPELGPDTLFFHALRDDTHPHHHPQIWADGGGSYDSLPTHDPAAPVEIEPSYAVNISRLCGPLQAMSALYTDADPRAMSRDVLLAEAARAFTVFGGDRAHALIQELERRIPPPKARFLKWT